MLLLCLILLPLTLFPGSSAGISFYTTIWTLYRTEYLFARWSLFTVCLNVWLYFSIRTKYKVLKNKIFYINIDLQNIWKAFIHLKVQRKMWGGNCFLPPANWCNKHAGNWKKNTICSFRNFINYYKLLLKTFFGKWSRLKVFLQALKMYDASAKVLVDKDDQCIILRYWLLMWLMTWWQFYWS